MTNVLGTRAGIEPTNGPVPGMKRLLFVDDETLVLEGLQRMLYPMRREWQMTFVISGREALKQLAASEYDVLITDVRMPEMSGLELLSQVVKLYPQVVRIVLSGALDQEITVRSAAIAHQFLTKPCNPQTLRATVEHALKNAFLLENPALKGLISRMPALPTMPAVQAKLTDALGGPEKSVEELGQIIAQDIGLSAKILQLANSAFFGVHQRVTSPVEAATRLGPKIIRSLALNLSVSSQLESSGIRQSLVTEIRNHGLAVGSLARKIGESLFLADADLENCFVGGLLHDMGKLVLASSYPNHYERILNKSRDRDLPISEVESESIGTTHAEVGGYLLWLWGIPESITQTVALHHAPPLDPDKLPKPMLIVHVADALVNKREHEIDVHLLEAAHLRHELPRWQALYQELQTSLDPEE